MGAFLLDFQASSKLVILDININIVQNGSQKNHLFSLY